MKGSEPVSPAERIREERAPSDGIVAFRDVVNLWNPYDGETVEPITYLDQLVLDAIHKHGNQNVIPRDDPYSYTRLPTGHQVTDLAPGAMMLGQYGAAMKFGIDYMLHEFRLSEPARKLIAVYHKKFARAELIVEQFKLEGGLDYRSIFSGSNNDPALVVRSHQSRFSRFSGEYIDFERALTGAEKKALQSVLKRPNNPPVAKFNLLLNISPSDAQIAEHNRNEHELRQEERNERLLSTLGRDDSGGSDRPPRRPLKRFSS